MPRAKKPETPRARKTDSTRVILSLGDDVSTDVIYPGRFMATVLPSETPALAFADHPAFQAAIKAKAIPKGAVIAAGENFGCGSSREQAASCLKGLERRRRREELRAHLPAERDQSRAEGRRRARVRGGRGRHDLVRGRRRREPHEAHGVRRLPLPFARQAIIDAGGLIPFTRARLMARA